MIVILYLLDQMYLINQFLKKEIKDGIYGNGYDYESLIRTFVDHKLPHLSSKLFYDSENGMFSVSSYDKKIVEELGFELAQELRKDKFKDYISEMGKLRIYL